MQNDYKITFTKSAVDHILKKIKDAGNFSRSFFRLSMKKYGCNGFGYFPSIVNELSDCDIEIQLKLPFRVCISLESKSTIYGTCVDFTEGELGMGRLIFLNSLASNVCGCGESFYFEDGA